MDTLEVLQKFEKIIRILIRIHQVDHLFISWLILWKRYIQENYTVLFWEWMLYSIGRKIFVVFIIILIIAITSWKLRYVGKQNYWVTTMFTKKLPDIVTFYLGYHIQLFSWFLSSYMQPGSRITRRHVWTKNQLYKSQFYASGHR